MVWLAGMEILCGQKDAALKYQRVWPRGLRNGPTHAVFSLDFLEPRLFSWAAFLDIIVGWEIYLGVVVHVQ